MPKVYPEQIRIGVTRVGGIGDGIVASCAIAGIRRKYPNSTIVGHTAGHTALVWAGNPLIASVIAPVAHQPVGLPYDLWYDLSQWPKAIHMTPLGERERTETEARRQAFVATLPGGYGNDKNCIELQRELLDIECSATDAYVRITPQDEFAMDTFRKAGPYVTVHDWAWGGRQTKCWYQDRWAEVVEWLKAQGLLVYQIGAFNEEPIPGAISLLGQTTFHQSAALVRTARLHIDNESSMPHLTPALGTPTIVMCGPTNWMHWAHDENYNLIGDYECTFSAGDRLFKGRCEGQGPDWYRQCLKGLDRACMKSITVPMVISKAEEILGGGGKKTDLITAGKLRHGTVSVIVIHSTDRADILERCLQSLKAAEPTNISHEVVVLNTLQDHAPTLEVLNKFSYSTLQATQASSVVDLCNQAVEMVLGRYVAFVRSDVLVIPDWLEKLLGFMETHQNVDVVAPKILFPDVDQIMHYGIVFDEGRRPKHWRFRVSANDMDYAAIREFQAVSGAVMLVRRSFFTLLGGFRADMAGLEDVDFCLRAKRHGRKVVCHPATYATRLCTDSGSFKNVALVDGGVVDRLLSEHGALIEADERLYDSIPGHHVVA